MPTDETLDELFRRYDCFVITDIGTVHYKPLKKAVEDIHRLRGKIQKLQEEARTHAELAVRTMEANNRLQHQVEGMRKFLNRHLRALPIAIGIEAEELLARLDAEEA